MNSATFTHEVQLRNKNLMIELLIISIIIVLFRLPFVGLLSLLSGLNTYVIARFTLPLPITITLLYFLFRMRIKKVEKYPILLFIFFAIMVGVLYGLFLCCFYPQAPPVDIMKSLSSAHLFLLFPFLLINLPLEKDDYRYIIDRVVYLVIIIGGSITIIEGIGIYSGWLTYQDVYNFIGGDFYGLRSGSFRPNGILADPAASSILLVACTTYYTVQKLSYGKIRMKHIRRYRYKWYPIIIGSISVFISGVLTSSLIFIFIEGFIILKYAKSYDQVALIVIGSFTVFLLFAIGNVGERAQFYWEFKDKYLPLFLPQLSTWEWEHFCLLGYCESPKFSIGEFHFFDYMLKFGFLPFIPWIILVCLPLYKAACPSSIEIIDRAPMTLCLVFLLSIVHYSGLERWGSNYVYWLAVMMLFSKPSIGRSLDDSGKQVLPTHYMVMAGRQR